MSRRHLGFASGLLLVLAAAALAADLVPIEDWSSYPVGTKGIPPNWQKRQSWGNPKFDFEIVEDAGRKILHLKSDGDSSSIHRDIRGKVKVKETPVLEWSWKVVALPKGADSRKSETDDQAGQIYVTWPRFPEAVRSRIIGYIWDTTAPAGQTIKSQKTGTVTYVVLRSGSADLGKWLTETRNVRDDFKRIYGEEPDDPAYLTIAIDSDDVKSTAEAYVGSILFRK
jgi:Protein of unknown function (DUF3047)